ncbi:MAG: hypothetical protein ACOYVG_07000 [Bacteroidota bacterium]
MRNTTSFTRGMLSALSAIILFSFSIVSCNKNNQEEDLKKTNLAQMSDKAKVNLVRVDKDWQVIASKNLEVITQLVESKIDISQLDFNNEEKFLNALGMTRNQYLEEVDKSRAASNRLIERYGLRSNSETEECLSCKTNVDENITKLKTMILLFRKDKGAFMKFQSLINSPIQKTSSVDEAKEVGGDWCCRWGFYACVAVCSASFPAFPAYLACCAVCYAEFCCS